MSLTNRHKYKYLHSTVQRAKDRRQKFHFCRLPFDVRPRNVKLNLSNEPRKARRLDTSLFFPANVRFNMAELMADSTEISSQNEENSVVQDEDQRARLTQFPQTRVRNMMKIDPDLHLANRESVFLLTRAAVSQGSLIRFLLTASSF